MIGGVSVSARNAVKVRKEVGVNAQAALVVDVNFQTKIHAFACASVSCLAEARAQLLASGDVEIEDEPKLEEDLPMEDDEGEFDSSDEDVSVGEELGEDREIVSNPTFGIFRRDRFEIKAVKDGDECRCEVPQSGWEGVRGVTEDGERAVSAVSTRMQVYLLIAIWMEEKHQDFLKKGPFGLQLPLCSQRDLLANCSSLKTLIGKTKDGGAASLSRYLKNVDLAWPEGVLPLSKCFGG